MRMVTELKGQSESRSEQLLWNEYSKTQVDIAKN